jgi:ZU5 domain
MNPKNLALIFLTVVGCGENNNQINITKTIGPSGGNVGDPSGTSVTVPMGALSMNTNITIVQVSADPPAGTVVVGPAFDFGPDGTTFSQPVTITLPFDSAKLPSGRTASDIRVFTAPRGSTQYTALQTTVSGNTVQTNTTHFTVYLPAAPLAVSDMGPVGPDFTMPSCTPSCPPGSVSGCGCTETCSTTTYNMTCTPSGGSGFTCTCTVNGSPQSIMPTVIDCTNVSEMQTAFAQCLG